jgi:hypothetical protein
VLGLLVAFLLSTGSTDSEKGMAVAEIKFFDSHTCYYLRGSLVGNELGHLVTLMKSLDMDKESIENGFEKIDLASKNHSERDIKQYFFYKADDDTIFTFVKSKKTEAQATPGRIEIKILEGENPQKYWAIYHLEKRITEGTTGEFSYTIKYLNGKYDYKTGKTRPYKSLFVNETSRNLDDIIKALIDGIQETINRNPLDAKKNGEILAFKFTPMEKEYPKLKERTLFFALISDITWMGKNSIDTFKINDIRRTILEHELKGVFNDLFSQEGDIQSPMTVFKNADRITSYEYVLDLPVKKLEKVLDYGDYDAYHDWKKQFSANVENIKFENLTKYIEERLRRLPIEKRLLQKSSDNGTVVIVVFTLLLVLTLYFMLRYHRGKLKREQVFRVAKKVNTITPITIKRGDENDVGSKEIEMTPMECEKENALYIAPEVKDEEEPHVKIRDFHRDQNKEGPELPPILPEIDKEELKSPCFNTGLEEKQETELDKFARLKLSEKDNVVVTIPDTVTNAITKIEGTLSDMQISIEGDLDQYSKKLDVLVHEFDANRQLLMNVANDSKIISESFRYEARFNRLLYFLNTETNLKLERRNCIEIIDKVAGEPRISKDYRLCAVNLHDEISGLEEEYQDKWFWKLLIECFFNRLKENITFFDIRNDSGKTIYDRYFGTEIPLREIEHKHIKKIVANLHWQQIWDGLIRMSDFFNAYFDDEMADIKYALGYYSQKIKKTFLELGYKVEEMRHLTAISSEFRKKRNFEQIDKSYIENIILKNLIATGNKQLHEAVKNMPVDHEQVIYVERLGLTDKLSDPPVQITNLRFGAYKKEILQAYFSSQSKKGSHKKNVAIKKKESKL